MKKFAIIGAIGTLAVVAAILFVMDITYSNREKGLRNAITAKKTDNKNEYDAMWKIISQTSQVAEKDRQSLTEMFNGYAQARTGVGDDKAIMRWVQEAIPNVDTKTMQNLQNIIVAQRDGFKFRQKELIDLNREHDNLIDLAPSSWFVGNRPKIDITIVTSTRTETAFQTGKDDDVDLFGKSTPKPEAAR